MIGTQLIRKLTATLFLASALAAAPVTAAHADVDIVFFGSGFGHGLGMSQWGAYGLAQKGWTHEQILTHYYTDTTVAQSPLHLDKIRVGLVDLVTTVHLAARNAAVTIRGDSPTGAALATIPAGTTYLLKGGTGTYKLVDGSGTQVATADGTRKLFATYEDAGAMLRSAEAGHTYNRGWIEFNIYQPCNGCRSKLRMIAVVTPQAYLYGLGEVPSSWPAEAMQAQAVAARTYAEYLIDSLGQARAGCNCGVYDDTRNQVYAAFDHEGESQGDQWVKAVDATDGEVVLYDGELIDAVYMSSSGGYTEDNENVWGGSPVPYLRGVCDPGDYSTANPAATWKVSLSADTVTTKLRPYTGDIGTVKGFTDIKRGVSARVQTVRVVGASGTKTIAGSTMRGALGLLDDRVWIDNDRNVTGSIRQQYDALACAPGLPKTPEMELAGGAVQRFADGAIYRNASTNRAVWLFGTVYTKYRKLHENTGVLGFPAARVTPITGAAGCSDQECSKTKFDNGFIFVKADVGTHELHGAVLAYFLQQSGVLGHLGFPTSDVTSAANGGTQATFQGGGQGFRVVTCSQDGSCTESASS